MKVPNDLATAFGAEFEQLIVNFALERELLPDNNALKSQRYLSRSVLPHILKLSQLFNRDQKDQASGLAPYWKESSNPAHLRLAYFLYFMPCNLFRTASVWAELSRLGFRWPFPKNFQAVEFGAGPASGACGIAAGEHFAPTGLPATGNWALIEQDKAVLELGSEWAQSYFNHLGLNEWGTRPFHRKIDIKRGFLPPAAPKFHLWLMSFYLNEFSTSPQEMAQQLIQDWNKHLEEEGIVILIEPALKLQSRKLLELRKALLAEKEKGKADWLQILLPCLGHQACGALAQAEDWCHEEVTWWRPPYFRSIDKMAGLDRKTLPFSYLVLTKSHRPRHEILTALANQNPQNTHRLVSPAHSEGRDSEFFMCGQDGKKRARFRVNKDDSLERGEILLGAELRGDSNSTRITEVKKRI
jgi:ribosomal protein RSM22 (predicted rRNA methylase)